MKAQDALFLALVIRTIRTSEVTDLLQPADPENRPARPSGESFDLAGFEKAIVLAGGDRAECRRRGASAQAWTECRAWIEAHAHPVPTPGVQPTSPYLLSFSIVN